MMYTTGLLALAYARPTPLLLQAARRAARYLYRTRNIALRRTAYAANDDPALYISDDDDANIVFKKLPTPHGITARIEFASVASGTQNFYLDAPSDPPRYILDLQRARDAAVPAPNTSLPGQLRDLGHADELILATTCASFPNGLSSFLTTYLPPSRFKALRASVLDAPP